MGSVPNTVFEEILEHVARNEAAGVLTTANRLLDAGNSPSQIARQFVRYLRNCVLAKIAGLTPDNADTELLQISPDERRRTARTATLFTEEELTRFMQVMLRTFDDLGFRQEQRFHLELGMLKLVHLQRLLPMEHFLSQLPRPTGPQAARVLPPPRPAQPSTAVPAQRTRVMSDAPTGKPSSPAQATQDEERAARIADMQQMGKAAVADAPAAAPSTQAPTASSAPASTPSPARTQTSPIPIVIASPLSPPTGRPYPTQSATLPAEPSNVSHLAEPHAVSRPDPSTGLNTHLPQPTQISAATPSHPPPADHTALPDADPESTNPASSLEATPPSPGTAEAADLQAAATDALFAAKNFNSAAEQLQETTWTLEEGEVRIQTSLSKQMLSTLFRADVEAIIKGALRNKGIVGLKLVFLPGTRESKSSAPKKPRTGSVQAKALEHPTVQAAQRLFNAEVTNVFDLRRD